MKIVYIAHPIKGDIKGNLKKISEIGRKINLEEKNIIPFAPYYFDLNCLDDNVVAERKKGMLNNFELLRRGFVDEVRLYGNIISEGMYKEIELCIELNIPLFPYTKQTNFQLYKFLCNEKR